MEMLIILFECPIFINKIAILSLPISNNKENQNLLPPWNAPDKNVMFYFI